MSKDLDNIEQASSLSGVDINKAVEEAKAVNQLFEKMGVKEATLHNGNYFNHNLEDNKKTVVTKGCIVEETENTVTVILKKEESTSLNAVEELDSKTQKALGAFVGKSQPWVSQNKSEE